MNRKKSIVVFLAVLLAVVVMFIIARKPTDGGQEHLKSRRHAENEARAENAEEVKPKGSPTLDDEGVAKPPDVTEADWQRFLRMHAARKASNQKVSFYGRVIDQNGDHVPGVVISSRVLRRETSIAKIIATGKDQIRDEFELVTDQHGNFKLEERNGSSLKFEKFHKDGYVFPPRGTNTLFMFGQLLRNPESSEFHHPDPTHPVIFTMWKKGKTEPLIYTAADFRFLENEQTDTLYLPLGVKPKVSPSPVKGWDIKASVVVRSRLDWELTLEGNTGCGFIMTDDVHTNLAPEAGYQPRITVSSDPNERTASRKITKIYFRGADGKKFAAFRMESGTYGQRNENNFFIEIRDLRINPNSSRNLEFDKTKQIK
jgi:hypothetical protein